MRVKLSKRSDSIIDRAATLCSLPFVDSGSILPRAFFWIVEIVEIIDYRGRWDSTTESVQIWKLWCRIRWEPSGNKKTYMLNLSGTNAGNPVIKPLAVLHLDNQLYINPQKPAVKEIVKLPEMFRIQLNSFQCYNYRRGLTGNYSAQIWTVQKVFCIQSKGRRYCRFPQMDFFHHLVNVILTSRTAISEMVVIFLRYMSTMALLGWNNSCNRHLLFLITLT